MNYIKFKPTTSEIIGELIGFVFIVALLGWALVFFFPLTWGQALVISWMYNKLIDVLMSIRR